MQRWVLVAAMTLACAGVVRAAGEPNTLTPQEQAEGWKLLFDGRTTNGWRGYKKDSVPEGWKVIDGALTLTAGRSGDIITNINGTAIEQSGDLRGVLRAAGPGATVRVQFVRRGAAAQTVAVRLGEQIIQ